ncbi:hypothetical protein Trihar35433_10404 [Trichoderma harzianum]|nr:hypothetical protein Trihar35433_10404 [Trichoderma harzianum]
MSSDPGRDTYTAGTSPEAPTLRYRGVTIQTQADLSIWIKTSPTDAPQCTVGPMLGRDLVILHFNGSPITLNEELWSLIEALPRRYFRTNDTTAWSLKPWLNHDYSSCIGQT